MQGVQWQATRFLDMRQMQEGRASGCILEVAGEEEVQTQRWQSTVHRMHNAIGRGGSPGQPEFARRGQPNTEVMML